MVDDERLKEYQDGYEAGKKSLIDEKCVKQFVEGYKSGYKEGYQAAMEDMKEMVSQMPADIQQRLKEEGTVLAWWPRPW